MKGKQIIDKILEQYKHEDINFDMYIVADAQTKTVRESDPRISHADESEFFSRMEFAEIASALFNVFGFAGCFTVRYLLLNMSSIIKYSRRIASFIIFRVTE